MFLLVGIFSESKFDLEEFFEACEKGNIQFVKESISNGIKVNKKSKPNWKNLKR